MYTLKPKTLGICVRGSPTVSYLYKQIDLQTQAEKTSTKTHCIRGQLTGIESVAASWL